MVEGARVTFSLREFYCHALSLSRLRRQLPPGGSLSHIPTDRKHHQRKILGGVRVLSAKNAEAMTLNFFWRILRTKAHFVKKVFRKWLTWCSPNSHVLVFSILRRSLRRSEYRNFRRVSA